MSQVTELAKKVKKAMEEDGITGLAARTKGYLGRVKRENEFRKEKSRVYRDLLFISGCNEALPHPHRYRVLHQMEQLRAAGYTCDTVIIRKFPFPWCAVTVISSFFAHRRLRN